MTKTRCDFCKSVLITGYIRNGEYICTTCGRKGSLYPEKQENEIKERKI